MTARLAEMDPFCWTYGGAGAPKRRTRPGGCGRSGAAATVHRRERTGVLTDRDRGCRSAVGARASTRGAAATACGAGPPRGRLPGMLDGGRTERLRVTQAGE